MPLHPNYKNSILDALLRAVPFTGPSKVFVSLHSADPGTTGASEITSIGRKEITFKASANGIVSSVPVLEFVNMPVVTVSHVCLWTAATGGSVIWSGPSGESKTFGSGDSCMIKTDALTAGLLG